MQSAFVKPKRLQKGRADTELWETGGLKRHKSRSANERVSLSLGSRKARNLRGREGAARPEAAGLQSIATDCLF
jgi:hypothetical protein